MFVSDKHASLFIHTTQKSFVASAPGLENIEAVKIIICAQP